VVEFSENQAGKKCFSISFFSLQASLLVRKESCEAPGHQTDSEMDVRSGLGKPGNAHEMKGKI